MIKVYNKDNLNKDDVIKLWMASFGDPEEYVRFFINNCPEFICIEYFAEDKLVSMLFLLEGKLMVERCKYLYAACTDSLYRRRGIMEELIEFTKQYCKENEYGSIFLVPANEKLYSYYSKFGFISSFRKKYMCIKSMDISIDDFITNDLESIVSAKKKLLKEINGFTFEDEILKYTVKEHLFNGGKVFLKYVDNSIILIFYYINNSDLIIKELLTDITDFSSVFYEHFGNKNSENIYICAPLVYNSRDIVEEYVKCGMCFPINKNTSEFLEKHSDLYAGMYLD